ncbi:hypothetical protein [Lentzea sp. CA-135723]|uniref:hypothetical protein n=1 Tax=Lentzea sp. CA-135723 TaxID=3239950 RepID=UPI003D8B1BFC
MSDWVDISVADFEELAKADDKVSVLVGRLVIDRLPFTFESKEQYFTWRNILASGLDVDDRDIVIVGSAATGRSINPGKKFRIFHKKSDVDIAVISSVYFERAWTWFRRTNPTLLGLNEEGLDLFDQHKKHYIFDGVIATNYFLSYLPFGSDWAKHLQISEAYLPRVLKGRQLNTRIYKDSEALRKDQERGLILYRRSLGINN